MIVVVGGAGYIGSVCVEQLVAENRDVLVVDDLSLGHPEAVPGDVELVHGEMDDTVLIQRLAEEHDVEAVMHFAALAKVGESMEQPRRYWEHNVEHSLTMFNEWIRNGVDRFVFSSSAAVYGEPESVPITEDDPTDPVNPYGRTKRTVEWYLEDLASSGTIQFASLRYFNAAGAGERAGEDHDPETHLIPIVLEAAAGDRERVELYGTDYPTRDGTCLRDFVHVQDLADAHLRALDVLEERDQLIVNLGTSDGHTVREVIEAAREVTGREIPVRETDRRAGDPARLVAGNKRAREVLGWEPPRDLETIIADAWTWKQNNPEGYES